MIRLKSILNGLQYTTPDQIGELEVKNVVSDSRLVEERDLFVAIKGTSKDGHRYIKEALERGAAAVILERDVALGGAIKIRVKDARKASALAAANLRGNPSRDIKVIGVTGTNGKTTVTYILENILRRAGFKVGVVGTVRYKIGDQIIESDNTTPSPIMLQDMLRRMVDNSLDYCVMEVSSHALDQHRTGGIDFRAAIFTNATQEHLDYHKNFRNYLNSKTALFRNLPRESVAIINRDDPNFSKVKRSASAGRSISFGLNSKADLYGDNIKVDINGSAFDMHTKGSSVSVRSPLIGTHNISNMLAAASCALAEGVHMGAVKDGLENIDGIPGRLQAQNVGGIKVFIDYAHTDDALEKVLKAVSGLKTRKLITVFGCGGNRDKKKRPKMGAIAAKFSDYVVITSDNPRHENPADIMNDITRGIPANIKDYSVIEERREAIIKALSRARDGDIVLIAGKGHEKYQIIRDEKVPFSDLEVVKEFTKTETSLRARRRRAKQSLVDQRLLRRPTRKRGLLAMTGEMFSVEDILKATGGRLLSGDKRRAFCGVSIDSRTTNRDDIFIAIKGDRFDGHDFASEAVKKGAAGVILSRTPEYKIKEATVIRVKDTLRALGDIAAYHRRRFDIPVVGITGSNGKTSVKELIWFVLAKRDNILKNRGTENNLVGLPLTLLDLNKDHKIAVLEMGANHLGEIGRLTEILRPTIGVITNIGGSHLEFLKDKNGVLRAKSEMVGRLAKGALLVLNGDDPMLSRIKTDLRTVRFGLKKNNDFRAAKIKTNGRISFTLNDAHPLSISAIGRHNVYNTLAAVAVLCQFQTDISQVRESLFNFKPPNMRMERKKINGVDIINDAYNSNPLSLKLAIQTFSDLKARGKKIMISGDMLELGEKGRYYHNAAGRLIAKSSIDRLIAVGELSRYTAQAAGRAGMKKQSLWSCSDAKEAANILKRIARSGDAILIKGSRAMAMEEIIGQFVRS